MWNEAIAAFVPGEGGPANLVAAGAADGVLSTHGAFSQAKRARLKRSMNWA